MAKTYTAVPSVNTGDVYTAASYNTYTAANVSNLIVPPAAKIWRTSNLTGYTTGAQITYQAVSYDTDSMWSSGTPTVLTIQTAGIYVVTFSVNWSATATVTAWQPAININNGASNVARLELACPSTTQGWAVVTYTGSLGVSTVLGSSVSFTGGSAYSLNGSGSDVASNTILTATWIGRTS